MDQLFPRADYGAWKQDATQPQPHADNGIPAKRTHDFDTYYISWEDYLRMVTVVCFKDNTEVRKPFEVQGDTIKSEQGWKLWKQGEVLLIKDIIEYYLE